MKQRVITAVIFGVVLISLTIIGGIPFIALSYLFSSIAVYELLKMKNVKIVSLPGIASLVVLWIFLLPDQYTFILEYLNVTKAEVALLTVLLFLTYTVVTKNRFTFDDVAFILMSTIYIGIGFYYFIETREAGLVFIFYAIFIIWATDSGAYLVGRKLGKRKLWPEISPNKTIEGAIGGIISAVIVSLLFSLLTSIDAGMFKLAILTVFLSVFGQIGDLVESALKRHYHVKDSGHILPGHGGILDRFDSLLFTAPLVYYYVKLFII